MLSFPTPPLSPENAHCGGSVHFSYFPLLHRVCYPRRNNNAPCSAARKIETAGLTYITLVHSNNRTRLGGCAGDAMKLPIEPRICKQARNAHAGGLFRFERQNLNTTPGMLHPCTMRLTRNQVDWVIRLFSVSRGAVLRLPESRAGGYSSQLSRPDTRVHRKRNEGRRPVGSI